LFILDHNFCKCCDQKARAAWAPSFALWQQATIEFTRWDHYYCLFAPHICGCCSWRIFCLWWTAHSVQRQRRGFNRRNARKLIKVAKDLDS